MEETRLLLREIEGTVQRLVADAVEIPESRRARLREIATWISARAAAGELAPLIFICTHNSRRSHLSQLWAQAFAWKHGLDHVRCYSGGTEATAFHPNAVNALRTCGFDITSEEASDNPIHEVRFTSGTEVLRVRSKTFDDPENPSSGFAAVLTCSDADEACPIVPGAAARFSLPYDDPKASDGTPDAARVYLGRSLRIAAEMLYMLQESASGGRRQEAGA
ncbi:MAG: protein-tyrosine-phosphatase [Bacteroidota bacterium]|jgi:arsenate reductase|nr:protein-tyrosine-phosphatase [Bacteroidota bacterium]